MSVDITKKISDLRDQIPPASVPKKLYEALAELFLKAGIKDPNRGIKFRMPDGTVLSYQEFYPNVIKSNNAAIIPMIKALWKDKDFSKVITIAGENTNNWSKNPQATPIEIVFDLSKTNVAQYASKASTNNSAIGSIQDPQPVNTMGKGLNPISDPTIVGVNNDNGSLIKFASDRWLVKTAYEYRSMQSPKNIGNA